MVNDDGKSGHFFVTTLVIYIYAAVVVEMVNDGGFDF